MLQEINRRLDTLPVRLASGDGERCASTGRTCAHVAHHGVQPSPMPLSGLDRRGDDGRRAAIRRSKAYRRVAGRAISGRDA